MGRFPRRAVDGVSFFCRSSLHTLRLYDYKNKMTQKTPPLARHLGRLDGACAQDEEALQLVLAVGWVLPAARRGARVVRRRRHCCCCCAAAVAARKSEVKFNLGVNHVVCDCTRKLITVHMFLTYIALMLRCWLVACFVDQSV